ncbi:MAG: ATP-dependent Lon protease [Acidimicrobiaceae bacterium]|jgi:Lon protease-like protein
MSELPMFPLGTVLFPSVFLPLHVFEPRYREMTRHCLDTQREFGVVLIERGSEVGGDDVRTQVGTVARIVEAAELEDGRWVLGTIGVRRIRVTRWLPDDPFPRAEVEDWDDLAAGHDAGDRYKAVRACLRRVLAMKAELGDPAVDATVELADDPALGSFQAAAVAPLGPVDQQALLIDEGPDARLQHLLALLEDEEGYLKTRLEMG